MLSFLRDQGSDDSPAEKTGTAGQTTSEGSPNVSEQDYIAVSTSTSRVRRSTAVLAVLLVAGLACIWLMVKKTSPQPAGAATAEANAVDIEKEIIRITGAKSEVFEKMDELVGKFNEFSEVPQVEVNQLVKNPFEQETFLANLKTDITDAQPVITIDHQAIRRQKAQKQADELNLTTIMLSHQRNCCMIDDKFFYQGDSIGDFTITGIESNFVKLLWNADNDAANSTGTAQKVEIILKLAQE